MGMKKRLAIIFVAVLVAASPARAASSTVDDIASQLVCQCGCTSILTNCNHVECMSREAMTALIKQKLDQGQTAEQIIQFFVDQYGEKVLASPPKRGFNLVAWVLPFAAILAGGGIIYVALRAWVKQGKVRQDEDISEASEGDEEYKQRLENELKEFGERGFR